MKTKYLILFLFIVLTSSFINAYGTVGDVIEKSISFLSPCVTFFVIAGLFAKYRGVEVFTKIEGKLIASMYVIMTVLNHVYPMIRYHEQTLPAQYLTIFFIQLIINIYIARALIK